MECPREVRAVWRAPRSSGSRVGMASFSSSSCRRSRHLCGDGFLVPELKDESEASEDDQTDNVSNEALYVIGLQGSGDKDSRYPQDWVVAKVALSCSIALDMLCQELYEVESRRNWFGFWTSLSVERQALSWADLSETFKCCFKEHFGCFVMEALPSRCWPLCFVWISLERKAGTSFFCRNLRLRTFRRVDSVLSKSLLHFCKP